VTNNQVRGSASNMDMHKTQPDRPGFVTVLLLTMIKRMVLARSLFLSIYYTNLDVSSKAMAVGLPTAEPA
jgi:hypothetical protein